ncbi:DUF3397 domain-containing protein [Lactovum odontotermitis]
MSIFTKLLILFFPIIVFVILKLIFRLLKLKRYTKIKVIDVCLIFLIFGLEGFTKNATGFSILPYYLMLISGIGLVLLLLDLFYYKEFRFAVFFRHFWRILSLVTTVMYICLIVASLFLS